MARYYYSGITKQLGANHANMLAALKVDESNPTAPVTILDQAQADGNGAFTLEWGTDTTSPNSSPEEWAGRIMIIVMDDNATSKLKSASNDWLVGLIGEANATYALWDPGTYQNTTASNGDLTLLKNSATAVYARAFGTVRKETADSFYFEVTIDTLATQADLYVGLVMDGSDVAANRRTYRSNGEIDDGATTDSGNPTFSANDVISVAYKNGDLWFAKNGVWVDGDPSAGTDPSITGIGSTDIRALFYHDNSSSASGITANFGATPFSHAVPNGFNAGMYSVPAAGLIYASLDPAASHPTFGLAAGDLTMSGTEVGWRNVIANKALQNKGKVYWEVELEAEQGGDAVAIGLMVASGFDPAESLRDANGVERYLVLGNNLSSTREGVTNHVNLGLSESIGPGDIVRFAIDMDTGKGWIGINNAWTSGDPSTDTAPNFTLVNPAQDWTPVGGRYYAESELIFNFGKSAFAYAVPNGFKSGLYEESAAFAYAALDTTKKPSNVSLSNDELTAVWTSAGVGTVIADTQAKGKYYVEFRNDSGASSFAEYFGLTDYTSVNNSISLGNQTHRAAIAGADGSSGYVASAAQAAAHDFMWTAENDIVMMAVDMNTGKVWFGLNGTWGNGGDPAAGTGHHLKLSDLGLDWRPAATSSDLGEGYTVNFGAEALVYAVPAGFKPGLYRTAHRYWRITGASTPSTVSVEFSGLHLYENDGAEISSGAVLSSSHPPLFGAIEELNDGILNQSNDAGWSASDFEDPSFYIQFDFGAGSEKAITKLRQSRSAPTPDRFMDAFTLEYSDNEEVWTAVGSASDIADAGQNVWSPDLRITPPIGTEIFDNSQNGAWYDIQDISSLWAGSDGSSPATVGGLVGRVDDKSGNGNHLIQGNGGAKPTLRQDGSGRYYLEYDGVDSHMDFTSEISDARAVIMAWEDDGSDSYTPLLGDDTVFDFHGGPGNQILDQTNSSANAKNGEWGINGSSIDPTEVNKPSSLGIISFVTAGNTTVGNVADDRGFARRPNGKLYGLVVSNEAWDAEKKQQAESLINGQLGIY